MGSGALSQGVKQPGCELNHPTPSSAKVKNEWNYTFTPPPPYACMAMTWKI